MTALALFQPDEAPLRELPRSSCAIELSTSALSALRSMAIDAASTPITISLPPLAAEVYAEVKACFAAFNIAWKKRRKVHEASQEGYFALRAALAAGYYVDTRKSLEFYATAPDFAKALAEELAEDLRWMDEPRILEPSAGDGAIVAAILDALPKARVTAVEIEPFRAALLTERFRGDDRVTIVSSDVCELRDDSFDGALMNPPFENAFIHIKHVASLVRRGGFVIGIASLRRRKDQPLATWLAQRDAIISPTPEDAFIGTTFPAAAWSFRKLPSCHDDLVTELALYPGFTEPMIDLLEERSRDAHRLFEDSCNGDVEEDAYGTRLASIRDELKQLLTPHGIGFDFAWDPRAGYGFRLKVASGRTNDFGKEGLIVPKAFDERCLRP